MQDTIDLQGCPLITADEYAAKFGISRRTVTRYIKQGKLVAVKRKGRTMLNDLEPPATAIRPELAKQSVHLDIESGHLDNPMFRTGQLSVMAKSGQRWKLLAIVLLVLVFLATPSGVWLWMTLQETAEDLSISQDATATAAGQLDTAGATITQLQAELAQERITAAELTATESINKELQSQLQDLRSQLADQRKDTALLVRLQATENQIAQLQEPE